MLSGSTAKHSYQLKATRTLQLSTLVVVSISKMRHITWRRDDDAAGLDKNTRGFRGVRLGTRARLLGTEGGRVGSLAGLRGRGIRIPPATEVES